MKIRSGRKSLEWLAWGLLFAVLSTVALGLTPTRWRTEIAPDPGDPVFNLWVIDWVGKALPQGLGATIDAPIFFPSRGALTMSDHWLGLGMVLAPLRLLAGEHFPGPIAVYNTLLWLSFALAGLSMAWVCRREGLSLTASFVAAAVFAFAPARTGQLPHLQSIWVPAMPLLFWFFARLLRQPSPRMALGFLAAYAAQLTGGAYLAYMIHAALLGQLAAAVTLPDQRQRWRKHLRLLVPTGVAAALLGAAFFLPYRMQPNDEGTERSAHEATFYGATVVSFLQPSLASWYRGMLPQRWSRPENERFPGFVALGLIAWVLAQKARNAGPFLRGLGSSLGRRAKLAAGGAIALGGLAFLAAEVNTWRITRGLRAGNLTERYAVCMIVVVACAIVLAALYRAATQEAASGGTGGTGWCRSLTWAALACAALSFPLFFVPLRTFVPGLSELRVPPRFLLVALVPLGYFCAWATDRLLARAGQRRTLAAAALVSLSVIDLAPTDIPWTSMEPAEQTVTDRWLRDAQVGALLDLPMSVEPIGDLQSMWRQTFHGKPLVSGFSGYETRLLSSLRQQLASSKPREVPLPSPETLDRLRALGVTHLRVRRPDVKKTARGLAALVEQGRLRRVGPMPRREAVFEILRPLSAE